MLTLISHIFNEEYLLPFWLEYHKNIFEHGIIIDYYSTDRSIEIIRKYCPTWEIITTRNINKDGSPNFKAEDVDLEVMDIESRISGFRICLNTTEFLFLTKPKEEIKYNYLKLTNKIYGINNIINYNNACENGTLTLKKPDLYFIMRGVWKGWDDFLSIDTTQTK